MPPEVRDAVAFTIEQMLLEVERWRFAFRLVLAVAGLLGVAVMCLLSQVRYCR